MNNFEEYKPLDIEYNIRVAVENLKKAYWSDEPEKVAKNFTEAEDIIISAICHHGYTVSKERTQGEWTKFTIGGGIVHYECSNCGHIEPYSPYFCPNCGADMRKGSVG